MRAMKDSGVEWIGEIPNGWCVKDLKWVSLIVMGQSPDSSDVFDSGNIPFMQGNAEFGNKFPTTKYYCENPPKQCKVNDILLSVRAPVGALNIADKNYGIGRGLCALRPFQIDNGFLWYALKKSESDFLFYSNGSTFDAITTFILENFVLAIPPVFFQHRIARFLDTKCAKIDAIIEKQQQVIEKLKAYKQSVITEAATKGLDPTVPMKDSGVEWIGLVPETWTICKFGNIANIKSNLVSPERYLEYPHVSPETIEKGTGRLLECKTVDESGVISWNHLFYKGQILYSKIRPLLNKVAIAPFDGLCSADMYPIETSNDCHFIVYMILSNYFLSQVGLVIENRVKMPKINQQELSQIAVVIPPLHEQKIISEWLKKNCNAIDSVIGKKQSIIDNLAAYKKSLIYEAVTGKMEV